MSRFIGAALIYGGMLAGWVFVGLFLVFAPARFGNLVSRKSQLISESRPERLGQEALPASVWAILDWFCDPIRASNSVSNPLTHSPAVSLHS